MQHPDDGLIEEYLDGELASPERAELEAHLAGCAACRERVETSRRFLAEASQLIDDLGDPGVVPLPDVVPAPARTPVPATRPRRFPARELAWAATLVIAAGVGYASGTWRARSDLVDEAIGKAPAAESAQARTPSGPRAVAPSEAPATPPADAFAEERAVVAAPAPTPAPAPEQLQRRAGELEAAAGQRADALRDEDVARRRQEPPAVREAEPASQPANQPSGFAKSAVAANAAPPAATLDDAVRLLGGSIRLIDGMEVEKVVIDDRSVVVLTYRDAAGNPIELRQSRPVAYAQKVGADSQRPVAPADRAERSRAAAAAQAPAPTAGALDAVASKDKEEDGGLSWTDSAGFRLLLRADADADSLRKIRTRIR